MASPTTNRRDARHYALLPDFDPRDGHVVSAPEVGGPGNWVGAPGATYDPDTGYVLSYRTRRPLQDGRGGSVVVARSDDGMHFSTVVTGTKDQLDARSIEKSAVIRDPSSGNWRLYVSIHSRRHDAWRIVLIEAPTLESLDFADYRTVITGAPFGFQHVKDPAICIIGGLYHAFVTTAFEPPAIRGREALSREASPTHRTLLLLSHDGLYWPQAETVFRADTLGVCPWGAMGARITSVVRREPVWLATFDGKRGPADDYREQAGLAMSHDLRRWDRVHRDRPWVGTAPYFPRYVDLLTVGDRVTAYYELPRDDGSHELRAAVVQ